MPAPAPPPRYRIVRRLSSGGQGVVYLAEKTGAMGFRKLVALKEMKTAGEDDLDAWRRLVQVAGMLRHRSIAEVHDSIEIEGRTFIEMKYIDGITHLADSDP